MNRLSSSELSFAFLIACSVKATILLIFAWIAASAARRRSAAFRHLVWAVGSRFAYTTFGNAVSPCMALGRARNCRWILELSAQSSCCRQFSDIDFDDR